MLGAAHNPTYSYLFNVSWDDEIFTTIVLFFTFMQVNIRGRNLEPIVTAIEFVVKDLPVALSERIHT